MKKCLSLLIALSLVLSMCVLPVSAADVDTYIFNETFDNYTPDVNWVTGADADGFVTAEGVQEKGWRVAGDTNGASVKVVDGVTATGDANFKGGKVLEVNAGTATNWFAIKKNALNADGSLNVNRQVGKNLVYEAMIFIPTTFETTGETAFFTMPYADKPTNQKGGSYVFSNIGKSNWIARSSGAWNNNYFGRYTVEGSASRPASEKYKGVWKHVKYVVNSAQDVANKDESDTSRFYMDDILYTTEYTADPKDSTNGNGKNPAFPYEIGDKLIDFHGGDLTTSEKSVVNAFPYRGTVFTVANTEGKTDVSKYYIDDLKAYFVDQFAMGTPVNTENYAKGTKIEVPFTTEVNAVQSENFYDSVATNKSYKNIEHALANDLIKLTDATGNVIENGIASATVKADDKKVVEIVLSDEIAGATDYKLQFAVEFRDVYGQGLNDHNRVETINVHTAEALDVLEAPEAINNLIPSDPRTFDIKFSAAIANVTATLAGNDVTTQLLDENKTVRVKFTEVAAGDLVINATGTAGQVAVVTIPVTVATGIKGADIINDDLSGLTLGTDLLADATGTAYYNGNFGFNIAKRTADVVAFDAEGNKDKAEIVADPDAAGTQGNVLKITNGTEGNTLAVNRLVDADRKASVNARGKVLVVESKYYLPAKTKWASGDYANYNGLGTSWDGASVSAYQRGQTGDTSILYIAQGQWNAYPGGGGDYEGRFSRAQGTKTLPLGQWVTITNVFDMTKDATVTRPDTVRTYVDGELVAAKLSGTGAPTDPIYDLFPESYYGEYKYDPATGELTGAQGSSRGPANVARYSSAATGITTRTNIPVGAAAYEYYVDDYKVYTAEDFTAEVVGNTTEYTPNQVVKILFNSQIPENQLAELYVVNKATGDKVEDATFTLANGGYAVDVKLPASVAKDEVYTVVAPTTFHDVTFQPLKNNLDWTFDITIGEYVPFKGEIDKNEIADFISGKTTKATLTLSKAVNSTEGIVVKNAEGVAVETGWTASLSSDGKTIVLDFTNLETADYTVEFAGLKAADGDSIVGADEIAITITAKIDKIMIFEEDFEAGYELDADWLEKAPENGKWTMAGGAVAEDFVGVVSADVLDANAHTGNTAFEGNVLKLFGKGNSPASARNIYARANSQLGAIDIEKDYPNKVIVYEADVYVKSTSDGTRILTPSFNSSASSIIGFMKYTNGTQWKIEGANIYLDNGGSYSQAYKYQTGTSGSIDGLNSTNLKASHSMVAVDQRNEVDTIKIFANDVQFTSKDKTLLHDHVEFGTTNYEFPMSPYITAEKPLDVGDFYGIIMHAYVAKNKTTDTEIYVDNVKAYLVDAFKIESVEGASTAFNMAKDAVKINFTNKVKSLEDAQANIKLVDATGNEVENGLILSLAEADYQVVATLNETALGGNAEYKVVVSPAIRDEYGVSLASDYYFYDYQPKATTQTGYMVKKDSNNAIVCATMEEVEAQKAVSGWASATVYEYSWTYNAETGKIGAFNPFGVAGKEGNDFIADTYTLDRAKMKLETIVKTTKATSLYAEATAAVVDGTSVSTTLKFTNPEDETLPVWYIVAAYGEYNEMIGCQAAALDVVKGSTDPIAVNFTTKSSDIKSIKVYVWDGYKTMVPYQDAEEIK